MPAKGLILVVDDERDIAALAAESLVDAGYEVITAFDGQAAIAALESGVEVELIFSDVQMPKVDGIKLLKAVVEKFSHIPICMVSGHSNLTERQIRDLGAIDYISKPYSFSALLEVADRVFDSGVNVNSKSNDAKSLVYVIEDEAIDQNLFRRAFSQIEHDRTCELKFFFDSESLLQTLNSDSDKPDLIIMDINLPGLSGLDGLERIRAQNLINESVKVIFLSSSKLDRDQTRAKDLGAQGFYSKPTDRNGWWHLARSIHQSWLMKS